MVYTACSYSLEMGQKKALPITVAADCVSQTKNADVGAFPSTHDIYLSACYVDRSRPELNGDYFVGRIFRNSGGLWESFPASYWPMDGSLSFLSLALDPSDSGIMESVQWTGGHCTAGVTINVPPGRSLRHEIMYASSSPVSARDGSVNLNFQHCEAWIEFVFESNADGIFRIDGIELIDAYDSGMLQVNNDALNPYRWNYCNETPHNYVLPSTENVVVSTGGCSCTSYIPEQVQPNIIVHYHQRRDIDTSWDEGQSMTFKKEFSGNTWHAGTHYVYNLSFTATGILFDVDVPEWTDRSQDMEFTM